MLAILYHKGLKEYDFGSGHPFRGDRYEKFPRFLQEHLPEDNNYRLLEAEPATDEDLLLISHQEYIDFSRNYYRTANLGISYSEQLYLFHSSDNRPIGRPGKLEEAARLVVGQAKTACDLVQQGRFRKVVSIGGGLHHAKRNYGEGFCIYNDVAFCGLYLMQQYKLERILVLDTDAHAGNGTSEYFYEEPMVLLIDIHQNPESIYPGTGFADQIGSGRGKGFTINIPMPAYAGYDSYELAFQSIVEPVAREFNPQIIIRNGGSDPHFMDGLTSLGLPLKGFRMIGEKARKLAEICQGKEIDLIASGYNEKILPYGWMALLSGLGDFELTLEEPEPAPQRVSTDSTYTETEKVIAEVKGHLRDYWSCLR